MMMLGWRTTITRIMALGSNNSGNCTGAKDTQFSKAKTYYRLSAGRVSVLEGPGSRVDISTVAFLVDTVVPPGEPGCRI